MRARLIVCCLFVCLACTAFAQQGEWYQGKPIKSITFEGLKSVKLSELENITEPYIGKIFNDTIFWELQGKIYALEYFDMISPSAVPSDATGTEVIIKFTVVEKPTVSQINFVGNNSLKRSELTEVVSLKVNDISNQMKIKIDELAIQNKYLEKGFPDVKVRSETRQNKDNTIILIFYINEGEKISIESIRFEGNSFFSERALKKNLSLQERGFFKSIQDGAFQEAKLIADRNAVTMFYHEKGYIDAAVTDVIQDVKKNEKGENMMTLTFRIYEGRIYTFSGISFEGNKIFSTKQLSDLVHSKTGEIVNARQVEGDLQRVADLYYENGYIFNTINREEIKDTENGTIGYKMVIVERNRAYIENIIVTGNKKTKDEVILREIPLEPGDVFSKAKVMDGLRNLYNLQYFSVVSPDTPQGSADNLMNLVINVEEQPTTDLNFGLTFSGVSDPDTFPISVILKYNDRNFLGYGNSFGAELEASPDTQSLALKYTQRWLFGLPLSGGFDVTASHTKRQAAMDNYAPWFNGDEEYAFPDGFETYDDYTNASKLPPDQYLMDYNQWEISLGFSTGYRWFTPAGNTALSGGIRAGFIRNNYDADLFRPFDPTLRDRNNLWSPENSIWLSASIDDRDIYYDPTDGYYAVQRVGFYGIIPMEREHYIRTDTKAEWFKKLFDIPLTEKFSFKGVFGIHSGVSFILPEFGYPLSIESSNQLYIDGMFVGRGWTDERMNRGNALWENWVEVRFPIVQGVLALDTFFDMAAVADTPTQFFTNFSAEQLRFSFGAGVRFAIPQFPFRFLLAKRFKIVDGQVQWMDGNLLYNKNKPGSGIDFVISFAMYSY